jgi:hypothetical protein
MFPAIILFRIQRIGECAEEMCVGFPDGQPASETCSVLAVGCLCPASIPGSPSHLVTLQYLLFYFMFAEKPVCSLAPQLVEK